MSIKPSHFRKMITDVLNGFDSRLASPAAIELLMMTASQESHLGAYLYQDNAGFGPAIGFYQIEPETHHEIFRIFFNHRFPDFIRRPDIDLQDPRYATIVARGIYANRPESLPDVNDIHGLASYYKRWFNTARGDAKIEKVIDNYIKYATRKR